MAEAQTQTEKPKKPNYQPGERSIKDIELDLAKEIHPSLLRQKKAGGTVLDYIPWWNAIRLLNAYAPGWTNTVEVKQIGEKCVLVTGLSIPAKEGVFTRYNVGLEDDDKEGYGDPASNSFSMGFRRTAALFGLGLYLYFK